MQTEKYTQKCTTKYAVGLDIGTTTISLVVVDQETEAVIEAHTKENDSFLPSQYSWEKIQDPQLILSKAMRLLEETWEKYPNISVIGLTGQMHGIVYLDENGACLSPLYTWQDGSGDVEFAEEDGRENAEDAEERGKSSVCQQLEHQYNIHASTGYGLITYLYHCKTGRVPQGAAKICTIMDYLGMVLTGRKKPLMHSSNAASLGLYDAAEGRFRTEVLAKEGGTAAILPDFTDAFVLLGTWKGIPVSIALGDNQASFLGSVTDADRAILVNMGTGGQVSVLTDVLPSLPQSAVEARPFAPGRYLLAGSSLCGGRAYAILKNFFALYAQAMGVTDCDHYAVMSRLLEQSLPEEQRGLRVCTAFAGTRRDPEQRGSIENIDIHNFTPQAFVYGVLDGMAEELWEMYGEIADALGITRTHMIASGNGFRRNRHLQNIFSRKFSMTLQLAAQEEEAACGAARAGMIAAGVRTLEQCLFESR